MKMITLKTNYKDVYFILVQKRKRRKNRLESLNDCQIKHTNYRKKKRPTLEYSKFIFIFIMFIYMNVT